MNLEKHIYTSSNSYRFWDVVKASLKGFRNSFYLANQLYHLHFSLLTILLAFDRQ
jgi:hypothetical protein